MKNTQTQSPKTTQIKVSQFIDFLLFDKKFGYYKNRNPIGSSGDFITSPEISQLFGEITAVFLLHNLAELTSPFSLVEMGAGHGTWFADILRCIKNLAAKNQPAALNFMKLARLHIIEINPVLQQIQKVKLSNQPTNQEGRHFQPIIWHETFSQFLHFHKGNSEESTTKPIIFLSNELFDCFAIDQYQKIELPNKRSLGKNLVWCERLVEFEGEIDFKNFDEANKIKEVRFVNKKFEPEIQSFVEEKLGKKVADLALGICSKSRFGESDI